MTPEEELQAHKALLRQMVAMYDNPEIKRVVGNALRGEWSHAIYEKYQPDFMKDKPKAE